MKLPPVRKFFSALANPRKNNRCAMAVTIASDIEVECFELKS
jgi:hypothetical protein